MPGIPTITPYPMPTADELPVNTADWALDPERAVLLVHDMQRYFLRSLPVELRHQLIGNVTLLREYAVAQGIPVAYTLQPGGMTVEQRGLLNDFWGPGMRGEAADREVVRPLAPGTDDWVLTKWRYSAFFNSNLLARMRAAGRDQLLLCGVYAHVGVLTTAIEAFSNDIQAFLVADAVGDFSPECHRLALEYAAKRCAVVVAVETVLAQRPTPVAAVR
ncbi:isochorismatase family protein [Nocardia sp. NPDC050175]|uniref:isochorismatase family protein n=1 Tax=Nocardia sp. NPDC050175 TaxID=3364317 RepID=UPI00379DD9FB